MNFDIGQISDFINELVEFDIGGDIDFQLNAELSSKF